MHHTRIVAGVLAITALAWTAAANAADDPQPQAVACTWIKTVKQLQAMRNNLAGTYCLANDVDASSKANFLPVGDALSPFTGRFYGNGFAISNLTITRALPHVGLFGLTNGAVIQDVSLINANVTGTGDGAVGGLVGESQTVDIGASSTIARVRVSGRVRCTSSSCFLGGIIGIPQGVFTLMESSSSATVIGSNYAGGAVGYLAGATISRTYATGAVTCTATNCLAGGLAARATRAAVNLSFATGPVASPGGADSQAGGLIGLTDSGTTISQSHAAGAVTGGATGYVAGLIARHNTGTSFDQTIDQTYAVGPVSSSGATTAGLIVEAGGFITNSYWDTETTGQATSAAGTGMTTAQLRAALPAGFGNAWAINTNLSYPFLNEFDIDFASPLATLVRANRVFTFLPISQLDASQYLTAPENAEEAALAAVYTMIARAIGITHDVARLKGVKIDRYFWDDATQTTTWKGPVKTYATLGNLNAITGGTSLANVIGRMDLQKLVILRGVYRKDDGSTATHWLLGTLYTENPDGSASSVVAHDPWTGQQVVIDPATKRVLFPADFPLANFRVNGFQPVTVN